MQFLEYSSPFDLPAFLLYHLSARMIDFELAPQDIPFQGFRPEPLPVLGVEEVLANLNERQREAAQITEGPLMVLAGAGSGKTSMLTARVAYLVSVKGVDPASILAVTFTNKAAAEMRSRIGKRLGMTFEYAPWKLGRSRTPEIGTFHSVCLRILRRELQYTPFSKPFVVLDDSDQVSLLKRVLAKLNIDPKAHAPTSFQHAINRAKCDGVEANEVVAGISPVSKLLTQVFPEYQKQMFENGGIDFGEILCMTYRVLKQNPAVLRRYQQEYQYLHVDEYQDTNRIQYLLLNLLASRTHGGHENLCVVGDEDQSIYKWRGADIRNILEFERDFPGAQIVKLEQNYRSTKTIIEAASQLISNNLERKSKTLWTDNEMGDPIQRVLVPDERMEAEVVVSEIERLARDQGYGLRDFAIFYRTHAQSRQLEDILRRQKIPYQIYGGLRFYDRKEIKDLLCYFRVVLNPDDSLSLRRILNVPARGIGKQTLDRIDELAGTGSLWSGLDRVAGESTPRVSKKIGEFVGLIEELRQQAPTLGMADLYHKILDRTGYVVELRKEATPEAEARIENLEELDNLLTDFDESSGVPREQALAMFLEQIAIAPPEEHADGTAAVRMMTLHSSKGLEFPAVFMVGLEDGLFPSIREWESSDESALEEERRLCYVGMTRAKRKLYMISCAMRRIWGQMHFQEPSRFFKEIPNSHVQVSDFTRRRQESAASYTGSSSSSGTSRHQDSGSQASAESRLIGKSLDHPEYGSGKIVGVDGAGPQCRVTIRFGTGDERKFVYRYIAPFVEA